MINNSPVYLMAYECVNSALVMRKYEPDMSSIHTWSLVKLSGGNHCTNYCTQTNSQCMLSPNFFT